MMGVEARKLEEQDFHDRRERDRRALSDDDFRRKYSNKKWYATTTASAAFIERWLQAHVPGRTVLDYCCGLGGTSVRLAALGATVYGIDISPQSVGTAQERVREAGFGDRVTLAVMDAEQTSFPDGMFDVIVCFGILHHLDVSKAFPELRRLLKPGGVVIAGEALGYNPLIAAYRRLTPHLRTAWEREHILRHRDLALARRWFGSIDVKYFHLFSIAATPLRGRRLFTPVLRALNWIDSWMLRVPGVRLLAWQMIIVLGQPRPVTSTRT